MIDPRDGAPDREGLAPPRSAAASADRTVPGATVAPDPARIAEGWTPRFVADPARAREVTRLYRELGFEVVADPIAGASLGGGCEECRLPAQLGFRMIYTREPRRDAGRRVTDPATPSGEHDGGGQGHA